jgi:hypothetical protein
LYHWPEDDTWRTKHFDALKTHTHTHTNTHTVYYSKSNTMDDKDTTCFLAPQTVYAPTTLTNYDAGISNATQHSVIRLFSVLHKFMAEFRLSQGAADVCIMLGYGAVSPTEESSWTFRSLHVKPQRCLEMSGIKTQRRRTIKLV